MNQKQVLQAKASKLLEQYGRLCFSVEELNRQTQIIKNQLLAIDEALKLVPKEEPKVAKDEQGS